MKLGLGLSLARNRGRGGPASSLFLADAMRTSDTTPQFWYDSATNRTLGSVLKPDGTTTLLSYNHATGRLTSKASGFASYGSADTHNTTGVLVLSASGSRPGQPAWAITGHNNTLRTRAGWIPGKVTALLPLVAPGTNTATYPQLAQFDDTAKTLYCFYRQVTFGSPNTWNHRFVTSTDGGATWSAATAWLQADGGDTTQRPYVIYAHVPGTNRIDFVGNAGHPSEVSNNYLWAGYMTVDSGGTREWFKSDGTSVGVDAGLPFEPQDFTVIDDGGVGTYNFHFLDIGHAEGVLTVIYPRLSSYAAMTTHEYYWTQLVAGAWTTPEKICDAGEAGTTPHGYRAAHVAPGACIDPNDATKVYLSRKHGTGDYRVEEWTRTAPGVWAKSKDISGATGSVNFDPFWVRGGGSTQIIYVRGTITNDTTWDTDLYSYPPLAIAPAPTVVLTKPASPAWQATYAPDGVESYMLLGEGSGTSVTDWAPGNTHNGTFTGTPTWASGTYGAELTGFSSANYVTNAFSTQDIYTGTYPFWVAALCKTTGTSATAPCGFGAAASSSRYVSLELNRGGSSGRSTWTGQSTSGQGFLLDAASPAANDGNYHVVMGVQWSATHGTIFLDGVQLADQTNATISGIPAFDLYTIGGNKRAGTLINPFSGTVVAVAHGQGGCPDPAELAEDWLYGVFAAVRA